MKKEERYCNTKVGAEACQLPAVVTTLSGINLPGPQLEPSELLKTTQSTLTINKRCKFQAKSCSINQAQSNSTMPFHYKDTPIETAFPTRMCMDWKMPRKLWEELWDITDFANLSMLLKKLVILMSQLFRDKLGLSTLLNCYKMRKVILWRRRFWTELWTMSNTMIT